MSPYRALSSSPPSHSEIHASYTDPRLAETDGIHHRDEKHHVLSSNSPSTAAPAAAVWKLAYLRPVTLFVFALTFSGLIIAVEVLLSVSETHGHGLATSSNHLHYLWTYGPTAILTLVASLWARVDCQAKLSAPWCKMMMAGQKDEGEWGEEMGTTTWARARKSLLLDYFAKWQPLALFSAVFQNGDYAVAAAALNSILVRIAIVLSTSLIVLMPTSMMYNGIPILLDGEFFNSPSSSTPAATCMGSPNVAPSTFKAMLADNVTLPRGLSSDYAYQVPKDRPMNYSQIATTVDAFQAGLDCEPAITIARGSFLTVSGQLTLTVSLENSKDNLTVSVESVDGKHDTFVWLEKADDSDYRDPRVGLGIASFAYIIPDIGPSTPYKPQLAGSGWELGSQSFSVDWSNSFICTPRYSIQRLDLTMARGDDTPILVAPSSNTTSWKLDDVGDLDLLNAFLTNSPVDGAISGSWNARLPNSSVVFDPYTSTSLDLAQHSSSVVGPDLLKFLREGTAMLDIMSDFFRQYCAILAQQCLISETVVPSTGNGTMIENRLRVQELPTHLMAGLFACGALLSITVWWFQKDPRLPKDPSTIIGLAALLVNSTLWTHLSGMGSAGMPSLESMLDSFLVRARRIKSGDCSADPDGDSFLVETDECGPTIDDLQIRVPEQSKFRPWILSLSSKFGISILLLGIIVTLEVLLRKSLSETGLVDDFMSSTNWINPWTLVPGLLSVLIGLYFVSADFETRAQTPFLHAMRGGTFHNSAELDLVDRHISTLLIAEIRSRSYQAFAISIATVLTTFLTIASASLFYTSVIPIQHTVHVQSTDSIYYPSAPSAFHSNDQEFMDMVMMILHQNSSYPPFTYENLVFPSLSLDQPVYSLEEHPSQVTGVELHGTLPATSSAFNSCRLYGPDQIYAKFGLVPEADKFGPAPSSSSESVTPLWVQIQPEVICKEVYEDFTACSGGEWFYAYDGPEGYFAADIWSDLSSKLWIWGYWTTMTDDSDNQAPQIQSVSALACNHTIQTVNTSVVLSQQDFSFRQPPSPHYESAVSLNPEKVGGTRPVKFDDTLTGLDEAITNTSAGISLDPFFKSLITSRYAIPIEMMGDPSGDEKVADAIRFQQSVAIAQLLSHDYRFSEPPPREDEEEEGGTKGDDDKDSTAVVEEVPGLERYHDQDGDGGLNVTARIPGGKSRVMQDEASTRVLQGLLAAILICFVVNWLLSSTSTMLPRKPTSIASVAALLADGNLGDHVRSDSAMRSMDEIYRDLGGGEGRFWIGWNDGGGGGRPVGEGGMKRSYGISVVVGGGGGGGGYSSEKSLLV